MGSKVRQAAAGAGEEGAEVPKKEQIGPGIGGAPSSHQRELRNVAHGRHQGVWPDDDDQVKGDHHHQAVGHQGQADGVVQCDGGPDGHRKVVPAAGDARQDVGGGQQAKGRQQAPKRLVDIAGVLTGDPRRGGIAEVEVQQPAPHLVGWTGLDWRSVLTDGVEQLLTVRQRRPRWMRKPSGQDEREGEGEGEAVRMRKARSWPSRKSRNSCPLKGLLTMGRSQLTSSSSSEQVIAMEMSEPVAFVVLLLLPCCLVDLAPVGPTTGVVFFASSSSLPLFFRSSPSPPERG
ncbi:hypothetical protein TYRP_018665 [Tyrophagus putrescentiae]|nr:hypothetical protein TYRP_018665 [Tyrophagus putrescentiae]